MTEESKMQVEVGKIPSGIVEGFSGIVFYVQTSFAESKEEHEEAVERIVETLIGQNEDKYTSWEETKRELLKWKPVSQVTVISFRIRDAY